MNQGHQQEKEWWGWKPGGLGPSWNTMCWVDLGKRVRRTRWHSVSSCRLMNQGDILKYWQDAFMLPAQLTFAGFASLQNQQSKTIWYLFQLCILVAFGIKQKVCLILTSDILPFRGYFLSEGQIYPQTHFGQFFQFPLFCKHYDNYIAARRGYNKVWNLG